MPNLLFVSFKQSKQEAVLFEIEFLKNDIINALGSLESWMKIEKVCDIFEMVVTV